MPGGDRTGPLGAGPMTGRGAGFCPGYGVPGYMNPRVGRGYGRGRGGGFGRGFGVGGGRGWRHWYYATGLPGWARAQGYNHPYPLSYPAAFDAPGFAGAAEESELAELKQQARYFRKALEDINKRIDDLKSREEDQRQQQE